MIEVTDADRKKWRGYTDDAIRGIKLIASKPDEELLAVADEYLRGSVQDEAEYPLLDALSAEIGPGTNPNWTLARVIEELHFSDRKVIDQAKFDYIWELSS